MCVCVYGVRVYVYAMVYKRKLNNSERLVGRKMPRFVKKRKIWTKEHVERIQTAIQWAQFASVSTKFLYFVYTKITHEEKKKRNKIE